MYDTLYSMRVRGALQNALEYNARGSTALDKHYLVENCKDRKSVV